MIIKNPTIAPLKVSSSAAMSVEVVDDIDALEHHVVAWEGLAADAVESNVFYEPWMLIPAVRAFGDGADLMFVFLYSVAAKNQPPVLCGFFPLERKRTFKGAPIPHLRLWRHVHCHLATPLIRNNVASATLRSFFEWLKQNQRGCLLMELPGVSGDGQFLQELVSEYWPRDFCVRSFTRALLRPRESAEAYLQEAVSSKRRSEMRRIRRRLEEHGAVTSRVVEDESEHEFAATSFLELEASGWKGRQGVALACDENSRTFFTEMLQAGLERRKVILNALMLDDRLLAMTCDLLSPPGCFGFKTAFDEEYATFAPGICLTLEHIRFVHSRPDIEWFDSCTSAGSKWVSNLWLDKRTITNVLIPTGMTGGEFALALFPLFHWLKGKFHRSPTQVSRSSAKVS